MSNSSAEDPFAAIRRFATKQSVDISAGLVPITPVLRSTRENIVLANTRC